MSAAKDGPPASPIIPTLILRLPGAPERRHPIAGDVARIGRSKESDIPIIDASVSTAHAEIRRTEAGWRLIDLQSSNGTMLNGRAITEAPLRHGDLIRFGAVEAAFNLPGATAGRRFLALLAAFRQRFTTSRFFAVSVLVHALIIILIGQAVLFHKAQDPPDFTTTDSDFVTEKSPEAGKPADSGASATLPPQAALAPAAPPVAAALDTHPIDAMLTTSAITASSLQVRGATAPSGAAIASMMQNLDSTIGVGHGIGRGFGNGSGLGKGLADWIGSGGIGISGRGKTLKAVNEFYCYFVIHSGDWYAALDWHNAPDARQTEISYPDLPDAANLQWYHTTPVPGMGPFISYFYGFIETPNHSDEVSDARGGCAEFTPGAMSNLLRFLRLASNNNIKGGAKPKAVVLDRSLVPYTYDKATGTMTWNPEGRERLRETLRKALPPGGRFGSLHGYLWNPQPADKMQTDFLVEYLLDVKPMPPFIYFTGNDDFTLNDAEIATLNEYLRRGGAVWGDCGFAGDRSKFDVAFRREMKRVVPDVDKQFHPLAPDNPLFISGDDAYFDLPGIPPGMQYYQAPIEVLEITPGVVSIVLTKNAYGNFLRYALTSVNNRFQIGGELGRGVWVNQMWNYRDEFFRGLSDDNVMSAYSLGSNILVYMLGRWPAVLNRLENR